MTDYDYDYDYDVIVVGAGSPGEHCAGELADGGLGEPRTAHYEAIPDVVYTDPLGPQAGEWLQQATLATRARVPLPVLRDVIQPFPTFSEIFVAALKALRSQIMAAGQPVTAESQ